MVELIFNLFSDGKIYLFFYLWFFILAVLEVCTDLRPYRNVLLFTSFIFLSFFTGLRWETGTDWESYKVLFDTLELNWTFLLNVYSFDLGYVLLNAFVKMFTNNYTLFLLVDSFIGVGIVFWFLKKHSSNPNISFFLFYNAFFVAQFMGSNRRMISLGAGLFVFYFVHEKKYKKYAIWQTIGFLFHRTSIMLILAWFIPRKRFTTKQILIILMVCLFIGIPQLPFKFVGFLGDVLSAFSSNPFVEKMLFYSENNENVIPENTNPVILMTLSVIKRSVFILFYLYVIKKNKGILDSLSDYFLNVYIVGFALYLLFNGSPIFQMISTYFTFIEIALIGRFWSYTDVRTKFIFLGILLFYGFFQLLSSLNAYPELYIPYKLYASQ
ncbi:EpsG family protein [Flavobacterium bizetiae]|uniref:EpsG family protein n=1 Tax=Flavobacterium bizetiae TaxID=2704140 RepID=UPI0021E99540|nr:EpsG family protein [Flavobacterium bizetiae]UTN04630.1 EpsG family protein [Flavobacterium bizetiae]